MRGKGLLFIACLLLTSMMLSSTLIVQSQDISSAISQIFGNRYGSGGYWRIQTYMTTPNPSISSPNWAAGPNALGEFPNPPFIESGPIKDCRSDCGLHPYGAWGTATTGGYRLDTSLWLAAGGWYVYTSWYFSGNEWEADFCSGSGCYLVIKGNLGTNNLHMIGSGGESTGVRWGSISTGSAQYKPYNSSTWYGWCYTSTWLYNVPGGSISACVNNGWTSTWR
jgi:hypothetical protein